jgi:hypothetical protein
MIAIKNFGDNNLSDKTRKFVFFILSYLVFTLSLSFFGAIFVTLQKGTRLNSFLDVVIAILKELYFLTPDHAGVWYVLFIIMFFFGGYWLHCSKDFPKNNLFNLKAFLSFGMLMPLSTTLLLHVVNLVS